MARTNHPLHPIAAKRLSELASELEDEFGRTDSDRKIVNALVYGATPAQIVGMLETFGKARRKYNDSHQGQPGEEDRKIGAR